MKSASDARLLGAVAHVGDLAEPDRRWPLRSATTSCAKSSGVSSRPREADRALVELAGRRGRPAPRGSAACSACTTCADADAGRLQRLGPELDGQLALDAADDVDLGDAGDARAARGDRRDRRAASARAGVSVVDDSASETIGRSVGLNRVRIGSSISGGRSLRIAGDRVADVLRRLLQVLLEQELDDDRCA